MEIPRILGIRWEWLLLAAIVEWFLRDHFHWHRFEWLDLLNLWVYVQAVWLKRAEPRSKTIFWYAGSDLLSIVASLIMSVGTKLATSVGGLIAIAAVVTAIYGIFKFKAEMEAHFNETDPVGLKLNGAMTFFFNVLYFQYHLHDIYKRKLRGQESVTPSVA